MSHSAMASISKPHHLAAHSSNPKHVAVASSISNPIQMSLDSTGSNPNFQSIATSSSTPGVSNSSENALDGILPEQKKDKFNHPAIPATHSSNLDRLAISSKNRDNNTSEEGFSDDDDGGGEGEEEEEDRVAPCHCFKPHGIIACVRLLLQKGKDGARIAGLIAWLLVLFYLLATTASDYFTCTLEKLSEVLDLSPAVAGVTLLAIGNGAPDVFASMVAFVSSDSAGSIGLSCVLGGALFITTVVSGTVALFTARIGREVKARVCREEDLFTRVSSTEEGLSGDCRENGSTRVCREDGPARICREEGPTWVCDKERGSAADAFVRIDLICFVRDALFLLASVGFLTVILLDGKVHLWEAISFLCVYPVYAVFVWAAELRQNRHRQRSSLLDPLLPQATIDNSLPQWVDVYQAQQQSRYHLHSQQLEAEEWENKNDHSLWEKLKHYLLLFYKYCIEWPFALPRRLTIPIVEEQRWSRPLAIASCTLAPLFVAGVWVLEYSNTTASLLLMLGISGVLGIVLGLLAFFYTESARPPRQYLWIWLAGGFLMSIIWFYLVADELIASLESLGDLFSISPAILGLTVLAWGNSVGDLVADLALACSGPDGVQIAISGCYAGPLFNLLVGLGLSLVVGCWRSYPEPLLIADKDDSLFYIIGFLAAGIAWALVIMPLKGMRLSRGFGFGLILLYCSFLVMGICYVMGWIS